MRMLRDDFGDGAGVVESTPTQEPPLPDTIIAYGVDGHKYEYNVIGRYDDGTLRTESWNAMHTDDCPCYTSEDW